MNQPIALAFRTCTHGYTPFQIEKSPLILSEKLVCLLPDNHRFRGSPFSAYPKSIPCYLKKTLVLCLPALARGEGGVLLALRLQYG